MTDAAVERRAGPDRRIRRVSLRYPERRSGFDRRVAPAGGIGGRYRSLLEVYRSSPAAIGTVLAAIALLSAADWLLTGLALRSGAVEVNPVMARLFGLGSPAAGLFKAAVTGAVLLAMWRFRRYRRVLEASLAVLVALGLLILYHLGAPLLAG